MQLGHCRSRSQIWEPAVLGEGSRAQVAGGNWVLQTQIRGELQAEHLSYHQHAGATAATGRPGQQMHGAGQNHRQSGISSAEDQWKQINTWASHKLWNRSCQRWIEQTENGTHQFLTSQVPTFYSAEGSSIKDCGQLEPVGGSTSWKCKSQARKWAVKHSEHEIEIIICNGNLRADEVKRGQQSNQLHIERTQVIA